MMDSRRWMSFGCIGLLLASGSLSPAQAQTPAVARNDAAAVPGAPAAALAVASRDANGGLVIRAFRLPERLVIDGKLDESIYSQIQPGGDFVQSEPRAGEPASEKTEVWVFFDDRAIYFGIRCWDSNAGSWDSLDMRRDSQTFSQNESVTVGFDTFRDLRNGFLFGTNPVGGLLDSSTTNERDSNRDWNTVWETRTGRFDGGWTVEMAIPFKSIRYAAGDQVWGLNFRRVGKATNELSYLTAVPPSSGPAGIMKMSSAAPLVGLTAPPASRLFELKPYAITGLKTSRTSPSALSTAGDADIGFDAKYGVTKSLTADFTFNTDFAQVEDDEQQVNLTRFSQFFPEKRDFFLEGQGIFAFGGVAPRRSSSGGETPMPFFSRRIGLSDAGRAVAILGGARATGRAGAFTVGAVNIQTKRDDLGGTPSTNFSVLRLSRDILQRSSIGFIAVNRSVSLNQLGSNQTYGFDGVFSFFQNLQINTYAAQTRTPGLTGDAGSYRAQLDYNADRYGVVLEQVRVGRNFNPEVGYVRRKDFLLNSAEFRFSPRPRRSQFVRKYNYLGSLDRFVRGDGVLETRQVQGTFSVELQNSDEIQVQATDQYEYLAQNFGIGGGVTIPVGPYGFRNLKAEYRLGSQHKLSGNASYEKGSFYGGSKTTVAFSRGRIELSPAFFVEPGLSINWVDVPQGAFVAQVVTSRFIYTLNPRAFIGALVQYNSSTHSLSTNARLRWEYKPGSELFIVYSDGRSTLASGFPSLDARAFTVKITRFFRT